MSLYPRTMYPWQQCWNGTGRTDQGAGCGSFRKRGVELYCFRKWLEGDKEREGKRTEGKGERSGRGKKSTKRALGRYSKAKNVLKTTC